VQTATHPAAPPVPVLTGLGQALRWLRERQARKQYQVASTAGITKGMLSAYETGRQRPSLETLDKLLETLGCDLNDLHNALQIVNGRPEQIKGWRGGVGPSSQEAAAWPDDRAPGTPDTIAYGAYGGFEPGRHPVTGQSPLPGRLHSSAAIPDLAFLGQIPRTFHSLRQPSSTPQAPSNLSEVHEPTPNRATGQLHQLLGLLDEGEAPAASLPLEEEQALVQMLGGFHNLLRYWHRCLEALRAPAAAAPAAPPDPPAREPQPTGPSGKPSPAPPEKSTPLREQTPPARGTRKGHKGGD
jgi:transcriptional regulator with XRE-family HTH domain